MRAKGDENMLAVGVCAAVVAIALLSLSLWKRSKSIRARDVLQEELAGIRTEMRSMDRGNLALRARRDTLIRKLGEVETHLKSYWGEIKSLQK